MNHHYVNTTTALLQFGLRTARRKKRAQYEDRDKQLLALHRERNALSQQQRNLGWIELQPPVMRGWKRYFVLQDEFAKSKQAPFFESLLSKINTTQYSYRKGFKVKKRKGGKKVHVATSQHLWQPRLNYLYSTKFTEAEKAYFEEVWVRENYTDSPYKILVFTEPWRFVLRVRLNIITKARARDEVIESRQQEIDNYLNRNALWRRLNHLKSGESFAWHEHDKIKEKNPLKNKPLAAILDEFYIKKYNT